MAVPKLVVFIVGGAAVAFCIGLFGTGRETVANQSPSAGPETGKASVTQATLQPRQNETPEDYVLRIYGDGLGLFRGETAEPYRWVEAEVGLLPPEDQAALTAGIHADNEARLRQLVEDFTS